MSKFTPESAVKFWNCLVQEDSYSSHVAEFCGMRVIQPAIRLSNGMYQAPTQKEAMEVAEFLRDIASQIEKAPELTKKAK